MSPIYEYICPACRLKREELRRMGDGKPRGGCHSCSTPVVRVFSAPIMQTWDAGRKFPNVSKSGDGSMAFGSRAEYERHLKANYMYEDSTARRKCATRKVTKYGSTAAE